MTGLIKKMVQYVQKDVLTNLCTATEQATEQNLGTLLVEVVASVLDNEVSKRYIFFPLIHIKICHVMIFFWKNIKEESY